ncbi:MAG TPA: hypothetical protein VGC86_17420, partial [Afipia sp.]
SRNYINLKFGDRRGDVVDQPCVSVASMAVSGDFPSSPVAVRVCAGNATSSITEAFFERF